MTNPAPALGNGFGVFLAIVGSDKILIGASGNSVEPNTYPGAAYLYDLNGTRLTAFTNPNPTSIGWSGDQFGYAVVAVGADKVVISAYQDDAGIAYLFSTDGVLLTTFTNPTPQFGDLFGSSVTLVGQEKVLIGASSDNSGASDTGVAYLFDLDGTLLTTIYNPLPDVSDNFGVSVAALSSDRIIIGASAKSIGATHAGVAYIFCLPRPTLQIVQSNGTMIVRWEKSSLYSGYMLDCSTNLPGPAHATWSEVPLPYQTNATHISVVSSPSSESRFYRLRKL